jgi:hypothetical protein
MTSFLLVALSLIFIAAPALAQQGGLPAANARIDALQAQNAALQQQISNLETATSGLQTQIDNITAAIVDDGTAQALAGTWAGSAHSVHLRRAVTSTSPGSLDFEQFFFLFPAGSTGGPAAGFTVLQPGFQPMTVQVNPEMWLARGDGPTSVTFTITRDGMKLVGNGNASPQGDPPVSFDLSGAVLSNNFFLLKLRVPATGNCAVNGVMILQGIGSLNPARTGMTFTGSALQGECTHMIVRAGLTKQP